jgi:hypothetical protein
MAQRSQSGWRWIANSQKFAVGAGSLLYEQQTPRSVCPCLWRSPGLVDHQHPAKAGPGKTDEREGVQAVTGADLGKAPLKTQHTHASLQKFIECGLVIERSWTGPLFYWELSSNALIA